jgi:hypothetical protein
MTKAISVTLPHELGRAEARRRIDEGVANFVRHLGGGAGVVTQSWDGDRLSFALTALGQSISGHIDVEDRLVRIELLLPDLLGLIAGKLRGRLQKEGQLLLDKK